MRLAKYLAHCGVASRRGAEQIIAQGRVTVAGRRVLDPARDVDGSEPVLVDGEPVALERRTLVLAMNKPAGVVSTARDTHGRPTVVELAGERGVRLYPVGRLDADSTGLLLLTNDGELANRLTHPRYEVPRTYRVVVSNAPVGSAALNALRRGVTLDDGPTAPAQARRIQPNVIELVLHEGRKRQVRRMCDVVGHPVRSLQRVAFGPLVLGELREGAVRTLRAKEIEALRAAATQPRAAAGRSRPGSGRRAAVRPDPGPLARPSRGGRSTRRG